jgi:voltage-gated potassium channel
MVTHGEKTPLTLIRAALFVSSVTIAIVFLSGLVMWLVDRESFPTVWWALWWSLQTVTTVGYGDALPQNTAGRAIAVIVMLTGIAFISVLTATVSSVFFARATRPAQRRDKEDLESSLQEIIERLDRLESAGGSRPPSHQPPH